MKINVRCPYCNSDRIGLWSSYGVTCHHDDAFTVPKGHYLICLECENGFSLNYHEGKKASKDKVDYLKKFEKIEKQWEETKQLADNITNDLLKSCGYEGDANESN
jgi:hypothetical protein